MTPPPAGTATTNPFLAAALGYAARGWPVLPLAGPTGGGKKPLTRHGCKAATTDTATIRNWWERWPDANVGIATGTLLVLDVDGPDGEAALADRELPRCPTATTGRGRHLYFMAPPGGAKPSNDLPELPAVHVKARGGYVVASPSIHETGRTYAWAADLSPDDIPPPPAPSWLTDLLTSRRDPAPPGAPSPLRKGERNDTLTQLAGARRAEGADLAALETYLLEVNTQRCEPPLSKAEVRRIAASVAKYKPGPTGPTVRVPKDLLRADLPPGAVVLYLTRQALHQGTGKMPRQSELAATLGTTDRTLRNWAAALRAVGRDRYERPGRRFVQVPAALLTDAAVTVQAKATALHLLACADKDGQAVVGQAALARSTGRTAATTKRHLRQLREAGCLTAEVAPYDAELGRRVRCNTYRLAGVRPEAVGGAAQKRKLVHHRNTPATEKRKLVHHEPRPLPPPPAVSTPKCASFLPSSRYAVAVRGPQGPGRINCATATVDPTASPPAGPPLPEDPAAAAEALAVALRIQVAYAATMLQRHGRAHATQLLADCVQRRSA